MVLRFVDKEGRGVYAELRGANKEVVKKAAVPWTGEAFFATHLRTGKLGARYLAKAQCAAGLCLIDPVLPCYKQTGAQRRHTDMRIFQGDKENIRNPEPGTVADDPVTCPGPTPEFLLSQAIAKASAVPTHHTVLINQAELSLQLFETLLTGSALCTIMFQTLCVCRLLSCMPPRLRPSAAMWSRSHQGHAF